VAVRCGFIAAHERSADALHVATTQRRNPRSADIELRRQRHGWTGHVIRHHDLTLHELRHTMLSIPNQLLDLPVPHSFYYFAYPVIIMAH